MTTATTKQQQITALQQEHAQWQAMLDEIGRERMEEPGVTDGWSMKDTMAHLTTWWRREIALMEAALRGERPPHHPPQDQVQIVNDWVYLTNRDRPLQEVVADADEAWRHLQALFAQAPEEMLTNPTRFSWLDGKALGPYILDNFTGHLHEEHEPAIRAWMARSSSGTGASAA